VNFVSSLEQHLAVARTVGISQQDIKTIIKLAAFIRGKAAAHVERLAGFVKEKEEVSCDAAVGAYCWAGKRVSTQIRSSTKRGATPAHNMATKDDNK